MPSPLMYPYNTRSTCEISYDPLITPVGQIVEIGERREIKHRFCTGFNILNGQYFLTAGHCLEAQCVAIDYYDANQKTVLSTLIMKYAVPALKTHALIL